MDCSLPGSSVLGILQAKILECRNEEIDIENRFMGRGVERVRCMKRVTWKLTLPLVK